MKKKKSQPLSAIITPLLYVPLCLPALFVFLYLANSPTLQPMRDSIFFSLLLDFVFSAVIIYFNWFRSAKIPIGGKRFSAVMILLFWLPYFIYSTQFLMIINTVFLLSFIVYILHIYLQRQKYYSVLNYEALYLGFCLFLNLENYSYVHHPTSLHFWEFALIIAIVSSIVTVILLSNRIESRKVPYPNRLFLPFLVFCTAFALMWCVACNMNYAFDRNLPIEYDTVIQEKDIKSTSRAGTRYTFFLNLDNTLIKLNVSQSEYHAYEVGDSFPLKLYQGAFDDPFYISGNQ